LRIGCSGCQTPAPAWRSSSPSSARKANPHRSRQARALTHALRDQLLATCPNDLFGLRDRALIQVGYDTLCRRSELVQLRAEDLERLGDGTAKILIRKSKTDPFGRGQFAYLSQGGVTALEAWLARSGVTSGPIFRGIWGRKVGKQALHPRTVNRILTLAAESAGLPEPIVRRLTAHSLRVGAAQDLAVQGRSLIEIMRAGRWASTDVVSHYVRNADVNVWSQAHAQPQESE
jgi:integrase/recombinase XerD